MAEETQIVDAEKLFINLGKQYDGLFNSLKRAFKYGRIENWYYAICQFAEDYIDARNNLREDIEKNGLDTTILDYSSVYYFSVETVCMPELIPLDQRVGLKYKLFKDSWTEEYEKIKDYLHPEDLNRKNSRSLEETTEEEHVLPYYKEDVEKLTSILREPSFLDTMLKDKKSLKDAFLEDKRTAKLIDETPEIEALIESFSDAMIYTIANQNTGNPDVGINSKKASDDFARSMVKTIEDLKSQGFTSTRKIAAELNRLDIPTARGGSWSHNNVSKLNIRIKELGLDKTSQSETLSLD